MKKQKHKKMHAHELCSSNRCWGGDMSSGAGRCFAAHADAVTMISATGKEGGTRTDACASVRHCVRH